MSSPIAEIRSIVQEHEAAGDEHSGGEDQCSCMERISYIMQVFYPEGIETGLFEEIPCGLCGMGSGSHAVDCIMAYDDE